MRFVRLNSRSQRRWLTSIVFASLALTAAPILAAQSVDLVPVRDNTLYQDPTGSVSNGAGDHCFAGMTAQPGIRRCVFAFDLSVIPAGSIIQSVDFKLTMDRTLSGTGPFQMTLHRVMASWGEGTSTFMDPFSGGAQGVPATANDATWVHRFFPATHWSQPGGDFDAAILATTPVAHVFQQYQWSSTPAMVALVQSWVNDSTTNLGWLLKGDEAQVPSARRFWTREAAVLANRPHLVVTYDALSTAEPPRARTLRFEAPAPNPFNPSTVLRWDAPTAGPARITIWDVRGSLVALPLEAPRPAGPQSFAWQARDGRGNSLSSGVYVVQLEQSGESRSRRVVLVR